MVSSPPKPLDRQVPCEKCPLRPLDAFREFSGEEVSFVSKFKTGELHLEPGATVFMEGANSAHIFTVLSGWGLRYKSLPDGRRQILNFVLPGDFIGLQTAIEDEIEHTVEALTSLALCMFQRKDLWSLYRNHPDLAFDVTWLAARQEQLLDDQLLNIGRRSAIERVAYLLLHLYARAECLGLASKNVLKLPLSQQHIADTLGLSLVHTNKTLRKLADRGLAKWGSGRIEIKDRKGMEELAHHSPECEAPRPLI